MLMDRRQLLLGALALSVAGTTRARASDPAAPAALSRRSFGDMTIYSALDGRAERPIAGFVTNADDAAVNAALVAGGLPPDKVSVPFIPTLIDSGGRRILIDTGNGRSGAPGTGLLVETLTSGGIDPASVTDVVISHFHPDHINGLRGADGLLTFGNAQVWVPEAEWTFWMDDGRMNAAPEAMKGLFQMARGIFEPDARMMRRYNADQEIAPGIIAVAAPGHTPGHMTFAVTSGKERGLVLSDTSVHSILFTRNPEWSPIFDMDAEMARATRLRVLDMLATEGMTVMAYHFPAPGVGKIERDRKGFAFVPA